MTGSASSDQADPDKARSLFRGKLWFWGPIAPLVALDLWSKSAAFSFLERHAPLSIPEEGRFYDVIDGFFQFVSWRNTGTVWGLAQDWNLALVALRFVACGLVVFFAWQTATRERLQQLVFGLILAGAIGNLYDNLTQPHGGVRDFLKFYLVVDGEPWVFPAFNVADSCICVGAITLALLLWRRPAEESASA